MIKVGAVFIHFIDKNQTRFISTVKVSPVFNGFNLHSRFCIEYHQSRFRRPEGSDNFAHKVRRAGSIPEIDYHIVPVCRHQYRIYRNFSLYFFGGIVAERFTACNRLRPCNCTRYCRKIFNQCCFAGLSMSCNRNRSYVL